MIEEDWENSIREWTRRLKSEMADHAGPPTELVVIEETDSTQDAARRIRAPIGTAIVALRQVAGRGRLGRSWADTGNDGLAVTIVLPRERCERLAIAAAVAVQRALYVRCGEHGGRVGIKWPNDIVMHGRKVAGVLVEQDVGRALLGIGINVGQTSWPRELGDRAISLRQIGVTCSRLDIAVLLMRAIKLVFQETDEELCENFACFDALAGTTCGFRIGEREVRGKVLRIDPMKGLAVLTENEGEVWLPAATTSVIKE